VTGFIVANFFILTDPLLLSVNSQYPDEGEFPKRVTEERGVIVNFASAVATQPPARCITYGPSKTAVLGVSTAVADFLGPSGIRVNTVSPSIVASAMLGDRLGYFMDELAAGAIFPNVPAEPTTISHGVIFLIENSFINNLDVSATLLYNLGAK
jgi:NAD(P)-dependent dehydrogenase (short-subunit alcohol dehydrogenase family)